MELSENSSMISRARPRAHARKGASDQVSTSPPPLTDSSRLVFWKSRHLSGAATLGSRRLAVAPHRAALHRSGAPQDDFADLSCRPNAAGIEHVGNGAKR